MVSTSHTPIFYNDIHYKNRNVIPFATERTRFECVIRNIFCGRAKIFPYHCAYVENYMIPFYSANV